MDNMNNLEEKLDKLGEILLKKQEEIDRKTKDIKAYRECNEKLIKLVKYVVLSCVVVFISLMLLVGYTVSQYRDLQSTVNTTSEVQRTEFSTENGGVIINGNNNSGDVNDGN